MPTRLSSGRDRAPTSARVADGAEHHLGLGRRRDDVGRDAAGDQADGVVRPPEHADPPAARSPRSATSASISLSMADSPSSGNDECAARPVARSLTRSTPRVARPSRLSVGSPSTRNRQPLGAARSPPARRRCPRSSPTTNSSPTRVSPSRRSRVGRRDLRGENALRVARPAAVEATALDAARKERRHAVEVGREHDRRAGPAVARTLNRVVVDRLLGHREADGRADTATSQRAGLRLRGRSSNRCRRARASARRGRRAGLPIHASARSDRRRRRSGARTRARQIDAVGL